METVLSGFLYGFGFAAAWRLFNGLCDLAIGALARPPHPA